ncbi:hypothetical protein CY34DRAFT_18916 [Suillus luteus UH-Slu-Lm8-n1]|uniref:CCHC-type domain-containing protein n=1 Tax=Suillus luteus UH-Slu-Lm8-n1 TaxID=930992 RepID=A0A0D0AEG3_9AGAM|nr:hypothetical protein CY34DRAFT_18916 [Suillus luteus UH-Slu-Lm8-n1]
MNNASTSTASSSATIIDNVEIAHTISIATQTNAPLAAIYKENISNTDEEAVIESAILSRQHALEIERILVERNAVPTATVVNVIRTAQLIEQEIMLCAEPAIKQSVLHYQARIRRLCYLLLPSNIKEDILRAIFVILDRTTTQVARPPSPHHLDEYVRIPSTPPSEAPKPILPPATPCFATKSQTTVNPADLELGTQALPIIIDDTPSPSPPNPRVARREQKRRLRINSKSVSPDKPPVKISPTGSLPIKFPTKADPTNFVCRNCKVLGHRHKYCPKYWCRICYRNAPGHLSIYCKELKAKVDAKEICDPPSDDDHKRPDFYPDLANWEARVDEDETKKWEEEHADELAEFEERYAHDFSDNPINYANQDD